MRILLASSLLLPVLAFAQVPLRPTQAPGQGPRPAPVVRPTPPSVAPGATQDPEETTQRANPNAPRRLPPPGSPAVAAPAVAAPAPPPAPQRPGGGTATTERVRSTDSRCVPLQGRFMLTFNKADVVDVLEQASRWTCRNFVYTEDIARGKITLLSKTPVTADEAYAAFLAALNSNNISVYATGRYYKLIRTADSKKNPIPTYVDGDSTTPANEQPITKVIRLSYADADQIRGIMGNFISPQGADVQSIPPDMLIITDIGLNLRRIEKLIDAVDRAGAGDQVRIVQVRWASAKDIADKINQIFQAQGGGRTTGGRSRTMISGGAAAPAAPGRAGAPGAAPTPTPAPATGGAVEVSVSKILPDERTNKLIIIADEKSYARIQELIDQLDVPTSGEGGIHVVFLRNANAEELAQTLSNLAQGQASGRRQTTTGAPAGGLTPTPVPGMQGTQPGTPPSARPGGASEVTAALFQGDVKITADKAQNALLIQASGSDFTAIGRLIERLDRPRRQVFVEAVIMEVNLRNEKQLGVGAHTAIPYKYKGENGVLPVVSAPGRVSSLALGSATGLAQMLGLGGFLTGFAGPVTAELEEFGIPSLGVLVQALQTDSDVNVLSTPHLLASDNEESEITVGQNVPFQAGYAPQGLSSLLGANASSNANIGNILATGGLSGLVAPIQRQNVELRLKIKPQINEGGNVRLTIEEQTEEIADRDPTLGPTTAKRSVKTQIVAKDQSTIVIGGLIQERAVRSVRKIPFFGSLPIVGWLFRDTSTTKQKTNLLLFLTPYIIRDEADYRRIYEKKRKEQQDFVEQFFGRQTAFDVDVDFSRKSGPYSRLRAGVGEETSRLENGGTGAPNERLIAPEGDRPRDERSPDSRGGPVPVPVVPNRGPAGTPPPTPGEDGTPVDRLDVQPDLPQPGEVPGPQPPDTTQQPPE